MAFRQADDGTWSLPAKDWFHPLTFADYDIKEYGPTEHGSWLPRSMTARQNRTDSTWDIHAWSNIPNYHVMIQDYEEQPIEIRAPDTSPWTPPLFAERYAPSAEWVTGKWYITHTSIPEKRGTHPWNILQDKQNPVYKDWTVTLTPRTKKTGEHLWGATSFDHVTEYTEVTTADWKRPWNWKAGTFSRKMVGKEVADPVSSAAWSFKRKHRSSVGGIFSVSHRWQVLAYSYHRNEADEAEDEKLRQQARLPRNKSLLETKDPWWTGDQQHYIFEGQGRNGAWGGQGPWRRKIMPSGRYDRKTAKRASKRAKKEEKEKRRGQRQTFWSGVHPRGTRASLSDALFQRVPGRNAAQPPDGPYELSDLAPRRNDLSNAAPALNGPVAMSNIAPPGINLRNTAPATNGPDELSNIAPPQSDIINFAPAPIDSYGRRNPAPRGSTLSKRGGNDDPNRGPLRRIMDKVMGEPDPPDDGPQLPGTASALLHYAGLPQRVRLEAAHAEARRLQALQAAARNSAVARPPLALPAEPAAVHLQAAQAAAGIPVVTPSNTRRSAPVAVQQTMRGMVHRMRSGPFARNTRAEPRTPVVPERENTGGPLRDLPVTRCTREQLASIRPPPPPHMSERDWNRVWNIQVEGEEEEAQEDPIAEVVEPTQTNVPGLAEEGVQADPIPEVVQRVSADLRGIGARFDDVPPVPVGFISAEPIEGVTNPEPAVPANLQAAGAATADQMPDVPTGELEDEVEEITVPVPAYLPDLQERGGLLSRESREGYSFSWGANLWPGWNPNYDESDDGELASQPEGNGHEHLAPLPLSDEDGSLQEVDLQSPAVAAEDGDSLNQILRTDEVTTPEISPGTFLNQADTINNNEDRIQQVQSPNLAHPGSQVTLPIPSSRDIINAYPLTPAPSHPNVIPNANPPGAVALASAQGPFYVDPHNQHRKKRFLFTTGLPFDTPIPTLRRHRPEELAYFEAVKQHFADLMVKGRNQERRDDDWMVVCYDGKTMNPNGLKALGATSGVEIWSRSPRGVSADILRAIDGALCGHGDKGVRDMARKLIALEGCAELGPRPEKEEKKKLKEKIGNGVVKFKSRAGRTVSWAERTGNNRWVGVKGYHRRSMRSLSKSWQKNFSTEGWEG